MTKHKQPRPNEKIVDFFKSISFLTKEATLSSIETPYFVKNDHELKVIYFYLSDRFIAFWDTKSNRIRYSYENNFYSKKEMFELMKLKAFL